MKFQNILHNRYSTHTKQLNVQTFPRATVYLFIVKKKRKKKRLGPRLLYGAVFYTVCPIIDRFNYKRNRGGTPIDIESEYRIQIYQGVNIECNWYNAPRFYLRQSRLQRNAL